MCVSVCAAAVIVACHPFPLTKCDRQFDMRYRLALFELHFLHSFHTKTHAISNDFFSFKS